MPFETFPPPVSIIANRRGLWLNFSPSQHTLESDSIKVLKARDAKGDRPSVSLSSREEMKRKWPQVDLHKRKDLGISRHGEIRIVLK